MALFTVAVRDLHPEEVSMFSAQLGVDVRQHPYVLMREEGVGWYESETFLVGTARVPMDVRYAEWGTPAEEECLWHEVGLTDDCRYGCKVIECQHGHRKVQHRRIYGCPRGI